MANPNALVDGISGLSSPSEVHVARSAQPTPQHVRVDFQGGRSGLLDMTVGRSVAWADVLRSLYENNQPAYVEIDPKTNLITELLCPLRFSVGAIAPGDPGDSVEVELIISHARHYLRRKNPDFAKSLKALQTARKQKREVLVTETLNGHEIIDVRPVPRVKTQR